MACDWSCRYRAATRLPTYMIPLSLEACSVEERAHCGARNDTALQHVVSPTNSSRPALYVAMATIPPRVAWSRTTHSAVVRVALQSLRDQTRAADAVLPSVSALLKWSMTRPPEPPKRSCSRSAIGDSGPRCPGTAGIRSSVRAVTVRAPRSTGSFWTHPPEDGAAWLSKHQGVMRPTTSLKVVPMTIETCPDLAESSLRAGRTPHRIYGASCMEGIPTVLSY